jgi:formylglycine-generating enzyme required for sulfatase activity
VGQIGRVIRASAVLLLLASAAGAQGAKPLAKCALDAVVSGTVCMDKYEASVWRVTDPAVEGAKLVKKIQQGKATLRDLEAAEPVGSGLDYGQCLEGGQTCPDIFAVSLAGVQPSAFITWFQAQQACKNSRKRLPTSAEWQAAVAGTPDAGPDNTNATCNTAAATTRVPAGSRSACVSFDGAFDMVGNLREWVADWVPRSTTCGDWPNNISSTDDQCLAGAGADPTDEPGALMRGGDFSDGPAAGPFAVDAQLSPSAVSAEFGFRCAR